MKNSHSISGDLLDKIEDAHQKSVAALSLHYRAAKGTAASRKQLATYERYCQLFDGLIIDFRSQLMANLPTKAAKSKNDWSEVKKELSEALRTLATSDNRSETARLRDVLDDLEIAIDAGVSQPDILKALHQQGFTIGAKGFQSTLYRLRRKAKMRGIPAVVQDVFDVQDADTRLTKEIRRKNLFQIDEAKKLQRDLDNLGSVEAVVSKYGKSKSWLSKKLSLLSLTPQAMRLISENISADLELINKIKTIETINPNKAASIVNTLKHGVENSREFVAAAKAELKPPPPPAALAGRKKKERANGTNA